MSDRWSMFGPKKHSVFPASNDSVDEFAVDLNLTPLMDVMSNILFFLLAGAGAALVSFMAASVPVQSESDAPTAEARADKVTLSVQFTASAYKVSLQGEKLSAEDASKFQRELPKKGPAYDNAALHALAIEVKEKFPASDTIVLVPTDATIYEEIIASMEATKDTVREQKRLRLFPKAVVADVVRAETGGE